MCQIVTMCKYMVFPIFFYYLLLLIETPQVKAQEPVMVVRAHNFETNKDSDVYLAPYVATIYTSNTRRCLGAIVHKRFIVTTAKCGEIAKKKHEHPYIYVGSVDDRIGKRVHIKAVYIPKNYDSKTHRNDLAIIKVTPDLKWSESVRPIRLPDSELPNDQAAEIYNYNRHNLNQHHMKEIRLYHINTKRCNALYTNGTVDRNMFCMGALHATKKGSCDISIGAPTIMNGYLYGLASWGLECTTNSVRLPLVFTDIRAYANIIHDVIVKCEQVENCHPFDE